MSKLQGRPYIYIYLYTNYNTIQIHKAKTLRNKRQKQETLSQPMTDKVHKIINKLREDLYKILKTYFMH